MWDVAVDGKMECISSLLPGIILHGCPWTVGLVGGLALANGMLADGRQERIDL